MPRFFMSRLPEAYTSAPDDITFDNKFMCRGSRGEHYVSCELELPFKTGGEEPLGFIEWVQVTEATYNAYRAYRNEEDALPQYVELVSGLLGNPIPTVGSSLGITVKFEVLPKDPTPYIRWIQPDTELAARVEQGATLEFWHKVVSSIL